MNLENTHYDAFISYRHCEPDMFVAKSLHKYLESFRLPRSVRKAHPELPARINRVFRDQEELPLVANLGDPITEALENSDNLIVICTPRLSESLWCRKEIETFISMHGRERIFAVLAEGEPEESFPKELLTDENGEPCEPLAADFRGKTKAEIRRKMKDEGLRLLAPMFFLNYDDLKQRHRERRMHRIMAVTAGIMAAVLAFGTYSTVTALKIKRQSEEIARQNTEISAQAEKIEEQYRDSQYKYEVSMANAAGTLMKDGRRMDALYALTSVMPDEKDSGDIPYAPEAERALAGCLAAYSTGDFFTPTDVYDSPSGVKKLYLSEEGTYLAAFDESKNVLIWNTDTNELLATIYIGDYVYATDGIGFISDEKIIMSDDDGAFIYDVPSGGRTDIGPSGRLYISPGKDMFVIAGDDIRCFDADTQKEIFTSPVRGLSYGASVILGGFSADGSKFAAVVSEDISFGYEGKTLRVFDTAEGSMISEVYLGSEDDFYTGICITDNTVYISAGGWAGALEVSGLIIAVDISSESVIWTNTLLASTVHDMRYVEVGYDRMLYGHDSSGIFTISADDGSIMYYTGNSFSVIENYELSSPDYELVIGSDGTLLRYQVSNGLCYVSSMYTHEMTGTVVSAVFKNGYIYFYNKGRDYICKYETLDNDHISFIGQDPGTGYINVSSNGRFGLLREESVDGDYIYTLCDIASGEAITEIESKYSWSEFIGDGSEGLVLYGKGYAVYSTDTGERIRSNEIGDGVYITYRTDCRDAGILYYVDNEDGKYVFHTEDVLTGENAGYEISKPEDASYNTALATAPDGSAALYYDIISSVMKLYRKDKGDKSREIDVRYGVMDYACFSSDSRYLFVFYRSGAVQIIDAKSGDQVRCIYPDAGYVRGVRYIPDTGGYIITGTNGVMLDSDLNVTADIYGCHGYDETNGKLFLRVQSATYSAPLLTYEELMEAADKLLAGYVPADKVMDRYGLADTGR